MKKIAVSLTALAVLALPSAAIASDASTATGTAVSASQENPGVGVGGNYGTEGCYIAVDYFRVDAAAQTQWPFVVVTWEGTIGGEVHCPVPPLPPIQKGQ